MNHPRMGSGCKMDCLYLPGSSEKCIQNEKEFGSHQNEFEIEGKRKRSKNWKRSVFCGGNSLEKLLQVL